MKRQFLYGQSGFTLFELMLVIAILAIFFAITADFNWKPRTNSERVELMAVSVASRLRTEIQNVAIGKMPQRNGNILKHTEITISTNGLVTVYKTGAAAPPISSTSFVSPFFEGDPKYQIQYVHWTGATASPHTLSGTAIMLIAPTGISFSGAGLPDIDNNISLEIRVKYGDSTRKITIDKRTGKITERKF